MEKIILKAVKRTEKPNKVRNAGFIPGVLNGPGTDSTTVQFEGIALNKIIAKHGRNAKLWVMLGTKKKFGFIKEVQTHPVENKLIHIAIQMVSKDQDSKMHLPINFDGHAELESREMKIQVCKPEIEVMGKLAVMPDFAFVDVSKKEVGDNITVADFNLSPEIKILDSKDEVYAIIKAIKLASIEETEETEEAVEVKPAE